MYNSQDQSKTVLLSRAGRIGIMGTVIIQPASSYANNSHIDATILAEHALKWCGGVVSKWHTMVLHTIKTITNPEHSST